MRRSLSKRKHTRYHPQQDMYKERYLLHGLTLPRSTEARLFLSPNISRPLSRAPLQWYKYRPFRHLSRSTPRTIVPRLVHHQSLQARVEEVDTISHRHRIYRFHPSLSMNLSRCRETMFLSYHVLRERTTVSGKYPRHPSLVNPYFGTSTGYFIQRIR